MNIDLEIARLVQYGIDAGLVPAEEKIFTMLCRLEQLVDNLTFFHRTYWFVVNSREFYTKLI